MATTTALVNLHTPFVVTESARNKMASVLNLINQLLLLEDVLPEHQKQVLGEALWKWTEAPGMSPNAKYNIRYCSAGVVEAVTTRVHEPVNHEHVHTRKSMMATLLGRREWTRSDLEAYFETHGAACIVTVMEHALLGQARGSGWDRYRHAGVGVFDRKTGEFVSPWEPSSTPDTNAVQASQRPEDLDISTVVAASTKAAFRPALLDLLVLGGGAGSTAVLQHSTKGSATYFRIHDTAVEEPTPAVAYCNFRGNVDFRLSEQDITADLLANGDVTVRPKDRGQYRVRCALPGGAPSATARKLLALALEKLRAEHEA